MRLFKSGKKPQEPNPQHVLRVLVNKNAWVKEFLHLCSENCISWIFGLCFENGHEWKPHHWNPQEPRIWCMHLMINRSQKFWEIHCWWLLVFERCAMLELLRQPCTFKFVFCVQNKIQILNGFLSAPSSLFHSHTLGGTRLLSHFADKKAKSNVESFSRITFRCKTYSLDGFALYSLCTWKCILWFIHFWDVWSLSSVRFEYKLGYKPCDLL